MSEFSMCVSALATENYIPEKLYPDPEEARRVAIARAMGLPMFPRVTETAMVRFFCIRCYRKFRVLGRVAMSGIFECPCTQL